MGHQPMNGLSMYLTRSERDGLKTSTPRASCRFSHTLALLCAPNPESRKHVLVHPAKPWLI